jgi:thiamine-monophosphate kinase
VTPLCSEDSVLARLARHFPDSHDSLLLGRGDDAAVITVDSALCVSSDLFLEDAHFRRGYFTPEEIGHKALAVNISDMAACGANPLGFTLCLGLPPLTDMAWLDAFFSGMAALARRYDCVLAGGDLAACERIYIAVTIWGKPAANGLALRRDGCRPGDILFVVGPLGLARVGLHALETRGREALDVWPDACSAHLRPLPLIQAGLAIARLADTVRPPTLMDISDGVARDLPRLLQGKGTKRGLGAALHLPREALHPEVCRFAAEQGKDPVMEALLGGEDYALLGACAPEFFPKFQKAVQGLTSAGIVREQPEITVNGQPFRAAGFDHYAAV